ncbi:ABC transporter permease [Inconstantimicrobium mannanitabidum]|uniref:Transport permease protein n=1 Tax=Inconstantimicrobium mannanitabidum TaxID=1604901 RepID=A0ACB5REL2_9CLOT|nr:ABC transporter permease [Clostridium sp. TW13]GKX67156.1 transport permease protein [Clostridium sp. TW13]
MNIGVLIKQDFKNLITNVNIDFFCFVYPFIVVGLFGFLFSGIYGYHGVTSYDYYGVSMMIFLIISAATITPNTFMEQRIKSANLRIAYSPISRWEIYASKLLSSYLFMGVIFSLDLIIFNALGIVNYGGKNFIYVLILFMALLLFSTTFGGAICVTLKSEELTNKIISLIMNLFALLSGLFFPIDGLGDWASKVANLSPLKWVLDSIFKIIYDGNFQNFSLTIGSLLGISLLLIVVVHVNYRTEDYI